MGTPKADLAWHGSTLLHRTTALLARVVDGPVVVVAAAGQVLPALPGGVEVVTDPVEGLGPLAGIGAGLAAVADRAEVAFACSTDLPFLHPAFVRHVLRAVVPGVDVALPHARGFRQPLAAAYRTSLAPLIAALLADGKRRPGMLYDRCAVAVLDDGTLLADPDLARLDPDLDSLTNVNAPDDYAAALAVPAPIVRFGLRTVRAATVGELGAGAVLLDGRLVEDPLTPLATGDLVRAAAGSARAGTRSDP
ncbi:NTP transferase domain-containing protein [Pseudonocardia petroleophila]|uniref:NTP transferase domain-containing protein n=2 Tax=Pseudonocardia petroleophila TaxID=37331 RepID=A0A7G7MSN0_9PSEU|nr:NTP transferase domain-containing protein [Pseudonocardia petroleophila]